MADQFIRVRTFDDYGNPIFKRAHFITDSIVSEVSKIEYKRGRWMGSGSNGTVYEYFTPDRVRVAAKFLHTLDEERRERFDFESLVLADLDHENIIRIFEVGEHMTTHEHPIPYIITDLFEGNLQGLIEHAGALKYQEVIEIGSQICNGFDHVHSKGVIHRDIKPANFFLLGKRVVIGDFGLAKTHTNEGKARYYREDITTSREKVGPQDFMSPELFRYAKDKSYPVDNRSDLWQIGAVLWYLLTGYPPRGTLSPEDDPSGKLFPLLDRAMHSKADKRYQSANDFKLELDSLK